MTQLELTTEAEVEDFNDENNNGRRRGWRAYTPRRMRLPASRGPRNQTLDGLDGPDVDARGRAWRQAGDGRRPFDQ